MNACGTAKSNRKYYPNELKVDKNVSVGSNGPLLASVWKDKRIIYILSTIHVAQASSPATVQRCEKDGTKRNVNVRRYFQIISHL